MKALATPVAFLASTVAFLASTVAFLASTPLAAASDAMPVSQQNALVKTYCAACHTDAIPTGALSLQHFDADHADPGILSMMVSKMKTGAFGASGIPGPDIPTRRALTAALAAKTSGANEWTVSHAADPKTNAPQLTASIVRELPSTANSGEPDKYRLQLTCQPDTHDSKLQLTWSPGDVPMNGDSFTVATDAGPEITYHAEYYTGATLLKASLPRQTLIIQNLFPGETVAFPFSELPPATRHELAACFPAN